MTDARITAGDADAPREARFPAVEAAAPDVGFAAAAPVADWLRARCGAAAAVTEDAGAPPSATWWRRDDGAHVGIGGGERLAAALLARDCGGVFDAGDATGPSVVRATRELLLALRDALVPGAGTWLAAGPGIAPARLRVEVAGVDDVLAVAVVLPPSPAAAQRRAAWGATLGAALGQVAVPVRLVLHEATLPMRQVRAVRVGEVLPIATASEVVLRVGSTRVARGRVVGGSDGDAGHIEIVGRGRTA